MYSSIPGAKSRAKDLKVVLEDSGFVWPLNKSQTAIAKAGGFASWHDLTVVLGRADCPIAPDDYRRRLVAAVPLPCRGAVRAWLDDELDDAPVSDGTPARYFRDVFPYLFASSVLHRSQTHLLRPGSGPGQQLRADLVVGPLLNIQGGVRPWPRLEPDSLAFVFEGTLSDLFGDKADHPRFGTEMETLTNAGLLDWDGKCLRILPPDVDALTAHVVDGRVSKAEHWMAGGVYAKELADALRDVFAGLGIRQARRVADAFVQQGSKAYTTESGAVTTLLTELASEGDLATFAQTYRLFAQLNPAKSAFVRSSVPAKVMSVYLTGHLRLDAVKAMKWVSGRPDWSTEVTAALSETSLFVSTVDAMAAEIRQAA